MLVRRCRVHKPVSPERKTALVFLLCLRYPIHRSYCICGERDCRDGSSPEAVKRHLASAKTPHKTSQLLGKTRQCLEALQADRKKYAAQAGLELLVPGDMRRRSADGESWSAWGERGSQVKLGLP